MLLVICYAKQKMLSVLLKHTEHNRMEATETWVSCPGLGLWAPPASLRPRVVTGSFSEGYTGLYKS